MCSTGPHVAVCLQEVKRIMEKTLSDLQIPLDIAEECLLQREKRTDIDQVHDEVEKCLTKVRRIDAVFHLLLNH